MPGLHVDDDGELLAFTPPDDLIQRLDVLPASYLREHKIAERMKVTFNQDLARRKLVEARQSKKTLWPEIAYLSDLHPMIDWLTDKVLIGVVRQQAPVIIANVAEPVFLIQGVYSNALGQPTVVQWMAISGLPDVPRIEDMTDRAERGQRRAPDGQHRQVRRHRRPREPHPRRRQSRSGAPGAAAASLRCEGRRPDQRLPGPARHLGAAQPHRRHSRKREQISAIARERFRETESFRTAGEPLLRILGLLVPEATTVQEEVR